jgi:ABC-type cobalamin/Fe3+-siderophores transport system ATPase subunit
MKSGDFMVIVGQVGCGKTSLLYSIMEEMEVQKGKMFVNGSISYVE